MRRISRSYRDTRGRCRRKSYYLYLYGTTGFDTVTPNVDLGIGIAVHKGMEHLLRNREVEGAAAVAWEEARTTLNPLNPLEVESHAALAKGLILGWGRVRGEDFFERYEIISIEEEAPPMMLAPGLELSIRADAVVRDRLTGLVLVLNWKTQSEKKDFTSKWNEEVQAWTEALGTENHLGVRVDGVEFHGFYKGVKRDSIFISPLTWGYKRTLQSTGETLYSPSWAAGWTKFPVWKEFPGGQEAWIDWLPLKVLEEMFPVTPPVMKDDEVVRKWLRQLIRYERDAQHVLDQGTEEEREDFFEQEFSNYNCKGCPFKQVCFGRVTIEDLVDMGKLRRRIDHHAVPEEVSALPS